MKASLATAPTNSLFRVIPPSRLFEILGRAPLLSLLGNWAKGVTRKRMVG